MDHFQDDSLDFLNEYGLFIIHQLQSRLKQMHLQGVALLLGDRGSDFHLAQAHNTVLDA
jgi:hypothetical protein